MDFAAITIEQVDADNKSRSMASLGTLDYPFMCGIWHWKFSDLLAKYQASLREIERLKQQQTALTEI